MKFSNIVYASIASITLMIATPVQSQSTAPTKETPILELLSSMADIPGDHKAIADYYRRMALQARDVARLHEEMKGQYRHSHAQMKGRPAGKTMQKHCGRIIKLQQSVAEEYDALAALHEEAAKE